MKNLTVTMILLSISIISLNAQSFLRPFESISHKKSTFLTLEDDTEIEGNVKKLDRKKGLIQEVKLKVNGEKTAIPVSKIKFAYFPQSGWDALSTGFEFVNDVRQWQNSTFDQGRIKDGYAYFEQTEVIVRKKQRTLLLQLLNPTSCDVLKIYHNPFANETATIGIKGFAVSGGDDKSYYLSKNGEVAYKFTKKNFKKGFEDFFADCPEIVEKYSKARWSSFQTIVFAYNEACK